MSYRSIICKLSDSLCVLDVVWSLVNIQSGGHLCHAFKAFSIIPSLSVMIYAPSFYHDNPFPIHSLITNTLSLLSTPNCLGHLIMWHSLVARAYSDYHRTTCPKVVCAHSRRFHQVTSLMVRVQPPRVYIRALSLLYVALVLRWSIPG